MADTADRRSEGKGGTAESRKSRERRKLLEAKGLCNYCGSQEVGGSRKTCYECSDKTKAHVYKSGFRAHLRAHDVDLEKAARELLNSIDWKNKSNSSALPGLFRALLDAEKKT